MSFSDLFYFFFNLPSKLDGCISTNVRLTLKQYIQNYREDVWK